MKFLCLISFLVIAVFSETNGDSEANRKTCVVKYLKDNLRLKNVAWPKVDFSSEECSKFVMENMAIIELGIRERITEEAKEACIMQEFRNNQLFDAFLEQMILEGAQFKATRDEATEYKTFQDELREKLDKVARTCHSDPTYGGAFDGLLDQEPTPQQQFYCFTKFVIENGFIDVKNVNVNPGNIATAGINCDAIIKAERLNVRKQLEKSFHDEDDGGLLMSVSGCIVDEFNSKKYFELDLAGKVLVTVEMSAEDKTRNQDNITNQLKSFSIAKCFQS